MKKNDCETLLDDYLMARSESGDAELFAIEAAIFVEECFGITLKDDEIVVENLGTPDALSRLVHARAGA